MMTKEEIQHSLKTLRDRLAGWTIVDFLETSKPEGVFGLVVEKDGHRKVQEVYATELGWWLTDTSPYRETLFIEAGERLYVPRPTSVNAGHSRHIWMKRCLGKEIHIASSDYWNELAHKHGVKKLIGTDENWRVEQ